MLLTAINDAPLRIVSDCRQGCVLEAAYSHGTAMVDRTRLTEQDWPIKADRTRLTEQE
jgi:hypothetical protein